MNYRANPPLFPRLALAVLGLAFAVLASFECGICYERDRLNVGVRSQLDWEETSP